MKQKNDLTRGEIGPRLVYLTLPMIMGVLSIVLFNFVDTFFLAKLGTNALAAISFTFPVVIFVGGIALGLGTAVASVISRAIGQGDLQGVKRLTTHGLILGFLIVLAFAVIGLLTMKPVFTLLGASEEIFPLIREYMTIWYIGMVFLVIPMVGNNAIRASGDTKIPGLIMIISATVNVILDPLLIFGLAGFPRLGLAGAALATVIARGVSMVISLGVLHFKKGMLELPSRHFKHILDSWKKILYIGIPSAGTQVVVPLSLGLVTRIAAGFGPGAVAAVGAGTKVGMFSLMITMSLAAVLVPFVGQNWGAKRFDRVYRAQLLSNRFSLIWGLISLAVFAIIAPGAARLFSDDPRVTMDITYYLWIVPVGYGLRGICRLAISVFNAINEPLKAAALSVIWMFGLYVPLAYIGAAVFELKGMFIGIALANIIAGAISWAWINKRCKKQLRI